MKPGDAAIEMRDAVAALRTAVARLDRVAGLVRQFPELGDGFDPRALAVARTNAETAELWAARAMQ